METACSRFGFVHTAEEGDTLYRIGETYGVTVSALIYANPYVDVYNIQPGDQICIPKHRLSP